jgi:signal transduction histidine kinase/ActR/RegA family two-component response regulator
MLTGALLLGSAVIVVVLIRRSAARPSAGRAGSPAEVAEPTGQRAERLRNLLLTRMSHDLRTPLNSIVTLSQLLAEESRSALSNEQRRYIEVIQRNGQNLLALINDILDLSAVESGQVELDVGVVNLTTLVQNVADECRPAARHKGIPLHASFHDNGPGEESASGPLVVQADPDRLRQVVQHLVSHAIAETQNGYVELVLTSEGVPPQARLRIHDTAEGLSDAARRALSEDFRDLDAFLLGEGRFASPPPESLPLLLAARLARRMGLRIGIHASPSDGVSFDLTLPLAGSEVTQQSPTAAPEGASASRPTRHGSGRVLLIEDDPLERRRVAGQLEALGYDVTLASSGEEGLALLRDGHFDAVVLDLVMPEMSGLEVLRAARSDERLADVPFVVLSALYMTRTERAVLGPKVTDVVRKGDATADELEIAIARAIAQVSTDGAERRSHDAFNPK